MVRIVLLAQLLAPPARADDADAHAAALVHLRRGVAAFRAGDYPRALGEFEAARELAPDKPNPHRWLALTHVQLGDCPSALPHIDAFLSRVAPDEPRAAELARLREMCRKTGVLTIDSAPPEVSLRIDGAPAGTTPYRALSMRAGEHTVDASKPGYRPSSRSVVVTAGGEHHVQLTLARTPPALTDRWWFWPAVAGTAATVVAVVFVATRDDGDTTLPPIVCDEQGCTGAP